MTTKVREDDVSTSLKGNKVATIDVGTQVARNFEILRVDKVCFLAGTLSLNYAVDPRLPFLVRDWLIILVILASSDAKDCDGPRNWFVVAAALRFG